MSGLSSLSSAANKLAGDGAVDEAPRQRRKREALMRCVEVVETGAGRVDDIVKRLARFARVDRAELGHVDVNECVADALAAIGDRLERIRVTNALGTLPTLTAAPADINQLLLSLLSNAVEAMPDGGDLTVTTATEQGAVVVTVADSGGGIEQADLRKVFDPGFTTKGVGVGGGYGLAIAYRIAEAHGGSITLESQPSEGTTARVVLRNR
jgi:signal transduction histidine kinase